MFFSFLILKKKGNPYEQVALYCFYWSSTDYPLMAGKETGAEVEFVRLLDLDIKYCTGCTACNGRKKSYKR